MFCLDSRCSKAKHCRDVLGRVLGRKNKVQNPSLTLKLEIDVAPGIKVVPLFHVVTLFL